MAEIGEKARALNLSAKLIAISLSFFFSLGVFAQDAAVMSPTPAKKTASPSSKKQSDPVEPESSRPGTRLMVSGKYLHLSCSRSLRDLKANRLECFGNVYIRRPSELLTADYAIMDLNTEQLHAEGNVVYFTPDTVIYGSKMDFNFVTETGVIKDGRVESDKYELLGESIERLGPAHFRALDGEYTTCRDCPASWKLVGRSIDLEVEAYATLKQVFVKINEAPALYLPFAVIPVKTKRQSGLLFPRFQPTSPNGLTFVQPYFWAISRNMDATLGAGFYALKGLKAEGEYRYVLAPRNEGSLSAFYLRDRQFPSPRPYYHRWAVQYQHNLELPGGIDQKLYYLDASDRDYSRKIGDIPGQGEPGYVSVAGLSKSTTPVSFSLNAKRIRNNLTPGLTGFDSNTVQLLPGFAVSSTNHSVIDALPLRWGLNFNYARFWRVAPAYDAIYSKDFTPPGLGFFQPGESPLRRAQRFNLVPEIYYPARIGDVLEVTPSVQYRSYYYLFDKGAAPPTTRGYLLAQTEVATTVDRIFNNSVRHKFRPSLVYSNIPSFHQDGQHPFIRQLKTPGFQFDESDIVPISYQTQQYFLPLGNSLSYRLNNKLILKTDDAKYKKVVELTAGQSINFIEFRKPERDRQPFSRFFSLLSVDTLRVQGAGEFYYYPYMRGTTYNLRARYIFAKYTRRLLAFERSLGVSYDVNQVTANSKSVGGNFSYSFNDFFSASGGLSYLLPSVANNQEKPGLLLGVNGGLTYQSPSQCYKLVLAASWNYENRKVAVSWSVPVNLSGEGFSNLQEGGGIPGAGR